MARNFLTGLFGKKAPADAGDKQSDVSDAPDISDTSDTSVAPAPVDVPAPVGADSAPQIDPPIDQPVEQPVDQPVEPRLKESPALPEAEALAPAPTPPTARAGFFSRLKAGLSKTSGRLGDGVTAIFTKKKLDDEMLEELENLLISADLGVGVASRVTANLARTKFDKEVTSGEVRAALGEELAVTLKPLEKPLEINPQHRPHIILMAGVNGAGKTTTIGKLAAKFKADGLSVMLAAGDTFRAAAIEQLTIWGQRTDTPVIARAVGADPAGLAFDAVKEARAQNIDVLMIDTAGRLQNKAELMDELAKIVRVVRKLDPAAPHHSVLVLDATVGQNAISQLEAFRERADITGLIMTKLDGTARGGVLVALGDKFKMPVYYIGIGEGVDDLQPFNADGFARALVGAP